MTKFFKPTNNSTLKVRAIATVTQCHARQEGYFPLHSLLILCEHGSRLLYQMAW